MNVLLSISIMCNKRILMYKFGDDYFNFRHQGRS